MVTRTILLLFINIVVSNQKTINDLPNGRAMETEPDQALDFQVPKEPAKVSLHNTEAKHDDPPFVVEIGAKNVGYLGRGYDILFGNPLDDSGSVDPGFRLPAVQLSYQDKLFTSDGGRRIPDNTDVIMNPSALFTSSFTDVRTENEFKEELSQEVTTTAGFSIGVEGLFSASGEFTQSRGYRSAKESIQKGGKVNIDIIGRASVYNARFTSFGDKMKATKHLENAIKDLPVLSENCPSEQMPPYYELLKNYGTHFTTMVTMGAKSVVRLTMTNAESMELKKKGISTSDVVSTSIEGTIKGVTLGASYGREETSDKETSISETLSKLNIKRKTFYIGGNPPSESSNTDDQGSTTFLQEWANSAREKPVPIKYELQDIQSLFNKKHLPNIQDNQNALAAKRKCIQKALNSYCSKVAADKDDCVPYKDGVGITDVIRFGDFINIKTADNTGGKYLNVPKDGNQFGTGKHAQYMKILPVDKTAYMKYGRGIHYGEPFDLASEHGGTQVLKLCGRGDQQRWNLFNSGNGPVKCENDENAIGKWREYIGRYCKKHTALSFGVTSPETCKEQCIQETNGKCQTVMYSIVLSMCSICDPDSEEESSHPAFFIIYKRENPNQQIPIHPQRITTLRFSSPVGKKKGDLVMKDDKVYLGIDSYGDTQILYDAPRSTFLKQRNSNDVEVKEDEVITTRTNINGCTSTQERGVSTPYAKDCSYWWKVEYDEKRLHTYPNAHYA